MKAITCDRYGLWDILKFEDVAKPSPDPDEVLIKIKAASVNSWDFEMMRGIPHIYRMAGLRRPQYRILGADVAGIVEELGEKVTRFKVGDAVFGDLNESSWGGYAEFTTAKESELTAKPDFISFENASALPQAGVMAYQGIFDHGNVEHGQKVLLNGAGGGVGSYAVQLAKYLGAEVTGVDDARKHQVMLDWGCDYVLDYKKADFTKQGIQYDFILDMQMWRPLRHCRRAIKKGGKYSVVGGSLRKIASCFFFDPFARPITKKPVRVLGLKTNHHLDELLKLIEEEHLAPKIEKTYSLEDTPEAFKRITEGGAKGKLVITIS